MKTDEQQQKVVDTLKRMSRDLHDARTRLREVEDAATEPIAIVAMGCRFPGGVTSPEDLWQLLSDDVDALSAFPLDRDWELDGSFTGLREGGFLYDASEFDAEFFGMSPREAATTDPEQRLLLEVAWEVFERAAIDSEYLRGSATGVFVGACPQGYGLDRDTTTGDLAGRLLTGASGSVHSGRLSYVFGLEGPAVTVDTACSSSLVAMHLAAQALRAGDCTLALAGGVSLMVKPQIFVASAQQGALAVDGRCKAFAAAADGTGFSEGLGLILLERLSDARRHGHPVLAVLRGSAVNQDGASNGLTAPNGPAQQRVIRQALADARLTPAEVDAVEAHGTGTALGDPIEAQALLATYGQDRPADRPMLLGSIKSNIGHTQAAAGVAGVIKMVMAMRHSALPRTLHVDEPTPHVDWSSGAISLLTEPTSWPIQDRPHRTGVSSFGMSGTNAHVILEQAPVGDDGTAPVDGSGGLVSTSAIVPWALSAHGPDALRGQADRLAHIAADPVDIGWSLASTRSVLPERVVLLGRDRGELSAGLQAVARGETPVNAVRGFAHFGKTAFVFPGQGSQWVGMATQLYGVDETFTQSMDACAQALRPHVSWSVEDVIAGQGDQDLLTRLDVVQPLIFSVMVSLAAVWRANGVRPDAVIGHSQGEIAAAHVAGLLSLEDAARIVAVRSKALLGLIGSGAMAAVALPAAAVRQRFVAGAALSVAASNGPLATVVAGEPDAVREFVERGKADDIRCTLIRGANAAGHTAAVEVLRDELLAAFADIEHRPADITFVSTVTGSVYGGHESAAEYWYRNMREPVDFWGAIRTLAATGHQLFVEPSPHPTLIATVHEILENEERPGVAVGTLRRDDGGPDRLLRSLTEGWTQGVTLDWATVFAGSAARRVELPTYAFQRQRHWLAPDAEPDVSTGSMDAGFWDLVERGDVDELARVIDAGVSRSALADAVPALASYHRRQRELEAGLTDLNNWLYEVQWRPLPLTGVPALSGQWLIVDEHGQGADVADGLRALGVNVTHLPARSDVLSAALAGEVSGVVWLGNSVAALASLVRELAGAGLSAPLWCVTTGAVAVAAGDGAIDPNQSELWGFGRVVALELPEAWGGLIDLPAAPDTRTFADLSRVLAGGTGEDQVALRASGVFTRRLIRTSVTHTIGGSDDRWGGGAVLITGGAAAVPAAVARHAVTERGARRLILVGRDQDDIDADLVSELSGLGASVETRGCDLGDRAAVATLFDEIMADGPLCAVVHVVDVADDATVLDLPPEGYHPLVRRTVDGARHLHELTTDVDLAAFVLVSSASGVVGYAVHAARAAASTFLDALADHRRALGLPGVSIAWGPWTDPTDDAEILAQLGRIGVTPMTPQRAIHALRVAVDHDRTGLLVADINWPIFSAARLSALFGELPEAQVAIEGSADPSSLLDRRLVGLSDTEQLAAIVTVVRGEVAAALGHSSGDRIAVDQPFKDLGLDSMTAVELRNRLSTVTGLRLSVTLIFDYPTVTQLARHVYELVVGTAAQTTQPVTVSVTTDEPIAVVAMGCRFPSGVASPEDLWRLVADGVDAIAPFPVDRGWLADDAYTQAGGFLYDAADFDPTFFGMSPREALATDPQQRLLLEVAWEVFERAGIDPESLRGSDTGVFAGTTYQPYGTATGEIPAGSEGYYVTGMLGSVASGRLSYVFGLEGPAVTVDTACSSSLVGIHLAAQSLRSGECSLALAGGVTVMAAPGAFAEFARQGGLASDGRSKSFAAAADGTGWGEGAGLVLLERLSDARRLGHPVLAVVAGSAVNQDGASNGLTAPNGPSQQRVIRQALANAGVSASEVDVVEAHGTGTTLGDPIEAQAILATYGQDRDRPVWLGSIKSNIGHTQAAAGVAGVIKMVMALQRNVLPRTLHVDAPTPHVDWSAGAVELLAEAQPWSAGERPRRAGVSSFGVSGTNAHVILAEATGELAVEESENPYETLGLVRPDGVVPWVVSGRGGQGLAGQAVRLGEFVAGAGVDGAGVVDVGWSLASARSGLSDRAVVLGSESGVLLECLGVLARGESAVGVVRGVVSAGKSVFVFPGQGAQWTGMAGQLYAASAVFAAVFDRVCGLFDAHLEYPLKGVVFGVEGAPEVLGQTVFTQAGLFAVEVALFEVITSVGVVPDYVVGHSIGEVTAAHVAGVLSLEDAVTLVAARGALMQGLPAGGVMAAVEATEQEITETFDALAEDDRALVGVAAVNGPVAVMISGAQQVVDRVVEVWAGQGRRVHKLDVSHAFHSPLMDPMLEQFHAVVQGLSFSAPTIPIVSNLTGEIAIAEQLADPQYWVRHVREPVRFADSVETLSGQGVTRFIEVGPGAGLTTLVQGSITVDGGAIIATLPKNRDGDTRSETERLLYAFADMWVHGMPVDWKAVFAGSKAKRIDLPTYAFQREHYWLQPAPAAVSSGDGVDAAFWEVVQRGDTEEFARVISSGADGPSEESLNELLPLLSSWRQGRLERAEIDDWLYQVRWQPLSLTGATAVAGKWLVIGADTEDIANALEVGGARVARTAAFEGNLPEDLAGVVASPTSAPELVALLQALASDGVQVPLWCVTRGAVTVGAGDGLIDPDQASLWGVGRAAALELPELWGGLIDLPAGQLDSRVSADLCRMLSGDSGEDQVALRPSGIFVSRLVRVASGTRSTTGAFGAGTLLITGGTGGLGAAVARYAVTEHEARRVVLVSRSGLAAEGAAELVTELTGLGADVQIYACDIANREAVADLLDKITAQGPLSAVIHTAGVVDDATILTAGTSSAVFGAKVDGARHLHELTRDLELSAFVLFSSAAATFGSAGQAYYAAANAYLDGLAEQRRAQGLPAVSIAWGPWNGAGMAAAAGQQVLAQSKRRGSIPMSPEKAVTALGTALGHGPARFVVADIDWDAFLPAFLANRPTRLFDALPEAAAPADAPAEVTTALAERLAGLIEADQQAAVVDLIRSEVAAVLGHASGNHIPVEQAFKDFGFDSMTAVELRNRLTTATGLPLPPTLVFDYPTPGQLAQYVFELTVGAAADISAATARVVGDEPIALVALGCRFPGGIASPEDLWRLVADGVDAITPFPTTRGWQLDTVYGADISANSRAYEGAFLHGAGDFDPAFFGMSPREALATDPQQRLLLEVAWEVFERAGIDPTSLRGRDIGVFTGAAYQGYGMTSGRVPEGSEGYLGIGTASSVASGRVSYVFGLEGPAVTIDTACSSSLVGIHLAAQALRSGECSLALAGGVTVMATPSTFTEFSRQGGLAPDGRCKAFAAAADGAGWGEGVGLVLLERLSDARRNGHPVLAVVAGSAVNQDGASNGLTAPNGPSQQRVIRQALANAGVSAAEVDVVEAHGTGTTLGDPIEAQALLATYGQNRERPVWLGSIKSNIGHTQAAAGVAGVIKMVLAMQHGVLPKTLHVDAPSSHVDWSAGTVSLLTEQREWARELDRPRRAGVSSFGVSGTNAHVILAEAPEIEVPESSSVPAGSGLLAAGGVVPWVVSGRGVAGLAGQAARLGEYVAENGGDVLDIGWSLASTRSRLSERAVVLGADRDELLSGLGALARGELPAGVVKGTASQGKSVFVFPGQGSQWIRMAAPLYALNPTFAAAVDECVAVMTPLVDWEVSAAITGDLDEDILSRVDVVQPLLFVVMTALAAVWRSCGVQPDAVVGHSQGEIAAAYVAGLLTLEDAIRVVVARSQALRAVAGAGGMATVFLPETQVAETITAQGWDVSVAAVNSPVSTVISGPVPDLERAVEGWTADGVRVTRIEVDYASHSAEMDAIPVDARVAFETPRVAESGVQMMSAVTGNWLTSAELADNYWFTNLRSQVRFTDAVTALAQAGYTKFIEVSAHPVLTAAIQDTVRDVNEGAVTVGTLRRGDGGAARMVQSLSEAWVHGVDIDWSTVFSGSAAQRTELPTYAFQRDHYWLPSTPEPSDGALDAAFWDVVKRGDAEELASVLQVDGGPEWDTILPALSQWHRGRLQQSGLDEWTYRVRWQPVVHDVAPALTGHWLVIGPPDTEDILADKLRYNGAQVTQLTPDTLTLDRAGLAARLQQTLASGAPLAGVVAFAATDRTRSVADLVALVQALADNNIEAPLWCVTRGAMAVGVRDNVDPEQVPVWGLGRVIGLELPNLWGGLVDLPAGVDDRMITDLCRVLVGTPAGENQLALRPSGMYARRLVRATAPTGRSPITFGDGAVLVTGGTGGLGATVARYVVAEHAVGRVVLVSRSGMAAEGVSDLVGDLTDLGAAVEVYACDIADRAAVAALLDTVTERGPLTAVIHAAGVGRNVPILELNRDGYAAEFGAKADGAWHLHELTQNLDLSAFVLYSSIAAVWGSSSQGVYAAANAYLDGLAEHRVALGQPATSIAWGLWDGAGMAAAGGADAVARLRRLGVIAMDPTRAVTALRAALAPHQPGMVVANVEWSAFLSAFLIAGATTFFDELPEANTLQGEGIAAGQIEEFVERLTALSEAERSVAVLGVVRSAVAAVLGHRNVDVIGAADEFKALGFDSLTAVELRNRLATETGLRLPPTLVFDYPTPALLADYLHAELIGKAPTVASRLEFAIADLDRIAREIGLGGSSDLTARERRQHVASLRALVARLANDDQSGEDAVTPDFESSDDDVLFDYLEGTL